MLAIIFLMSKFFLGLHVICSDIITTKTMIKPSSLKVCTVKNILTFIVTPRNFIIAKKLRGVTTKSKI